MMSLMTVLYHFLGGFEEKPKKFSQCSRCDGQDSN